MSTKSTEQLIVVPQSRRVVLYHRDAVGNDLTAVLRWCETHNDPVWVHGDGSFTCPHTLVVEVDTGDHVIVTAPWESPA